MQLLIFLVVAVLVWAISKTPINPLFNSILIHTVISLGASITIIRFILDYLSKKPPAPGFGLGVVVFGLPFTFVICIPFSILVVKIFKLIIKNFIT